MIGQGLREPVQRARPELCQGGIFANRIDRAPQLLAGIDQGPCFGTRLSVSLIVSSLFVDLPLNGGPGFSFHKFLVACAGLVAPLPRCWRRNRE